MENFPVSLLLILLLLWTAVSDLLYRHISNALVLAFLLLWLAWQAMPLWWSGVPLTPHVAVNGLHQWQSGALVAGGTLLAGYGLFKAGWMGAGDVKLISVLCLWMGREAGTFILVTSLAGGIQALLWPLLRHVETRLVRGAALLTTYLPGRNRRASIARQEADARAHTLPYGLAIAAGAASVLWGYA